VPKLTAPLDANNLKVLNVGTPSATGDAVNKAYCDTQDPSAGLHQRVHLSAAEHIGRHQVLFDWDAVSLPDLRAKEYDDHRLSIRHHDGGSIGNGSSCAVPLEREWHPIGARANSTVSGISTAATGNVTGTLGTPLTLSAGLYWTGLIIAVATPYIMGTSLASSQPARRCRQRERQ
jgi:hypothetical protein